jgi:methylase of polypeptide subunit release factors
VDDFNRAAWAGGERGLSLTNRVLSLAPKLLSDNGFALVRIHLKTFKGDIIFLSIRRIIRAHFKILSFSIQYPNQFTQA